MNQTLAEGKPSFLIRVSEYYVNLRKLFAKFCLYVPEVFKVALKNVQTSVLQERCKGWYDYSDGGFQHA